VSGEAEATSEHLEQRARLLHDCLNKLPTDHRDVLHLRYHESLSIEDMAVKLDRTVCALYRLLSRIRQSLHECVTKSLTKAENEYT
jgi:RNA polymerase sigma-70 factor (ECF subfamily)